MVFTPKNQRPLIGVILAGGQGTRMGGCEKALLDFHGETLLTRGINRIKCQVSSLIINANRQLDDYRSYGLPIVMDQPRYAGMGPMAGIQAALLHAWEANGFQDCWLLTAPCDCPFMPTDLAERLMATAEQTDSLCAVTWDGERMHPTFSLVHSTLLPALTESLEGGKYTLGRWLQESSVVYADFSDHLAAFENINTPEQLRAGTGNL